MILDNKGISQKKFFLSVIRAGYMQELLYNYFRLEFFEMYPVLYPVLCYCRAGKADSPAGRLFFPPGGISCLFINIHRQQLISNLYQRHACLRKE